MKISKIFFLIIIFTLEIFPQKYYSNQSVEDILKLSEEEINIGIASLVLAKEFYPNLNVQIFLQTFDYLADKYKYFFGWYENPEDRIGALNTYLYKPGFWNDSIIYCYDDDDLHVAKLDNKFINGYIANKKGSCITMPMLYIILAERLGFPIYPVRSAKHFFVRYIPENIDKKLKQNIETTNGGGFISDKQYSQDVLIPEKAIKNGVYLRTLTKKEYIASLLLINANEYIKQKDIEKAKHYFQLAIKYDSTFSSSYWNYGLTAFGEARQLEEKMWEEKQKIISEQGFLSELTNKNNEDSTLPEAVHHKTNKKQRNSQTSNQNIQVVELQHELMRIEKKYEHLILEKLKVYKEYTQKAEYLGIVHEFPLEFFEKQIESINKFKQQGGY